MTEDLGPLRYCGIFDLIWQESQDFAVLLVKNCLSNVSNRKAVIIPPKHVIKAIQKMDTEKQKETLMCYILSKAKSFDKIKNSSKVTTISGKSYNVTVNDNKVLLNNVEVTHLKMHKGKSILKAEDKLEPTSIGGSCGAVDFDEKSGSDYSENSLEGVDQESTTEEESETESETDTDSDSETETESENESKSKSKKKMSKKKSGGSLKKKRSKSSTRRRSKSPSRRHKKSKSSKSKKSKVKGGVKKKAPLRYYYV